MRWKQFYLWFLVIRLKLQSRSQHERDIARQTRLLQHIISLDNVTHSLNKHLRAMILGNLSISLQRQAQYHGGAEAQSLLEQASTFIQEASDIFLQERNDERDQSRKADLVIDYAKAQLNLGNVLYTLASRHIGVESSRFMDDSHDCYEQALRIFTIAKDDEDIAFDYALTQMNKGNLLSLRAERKGGEDADRLDDEALVCYDEALHFLKPGSAEHATTLMNKAGILRGRGERAGGKEGRNLYQQALDYYTAALSDLDPENPTYTVALMQMAYTLQDIARLQGGVDAVAFLKQAIDAYDAILNTTDRLKRSEDYAEAQADKGTALHALARLREDAEAIPLLEQAITCYDEALKIRDPTHMAPQYAATQQSKGNALLKLAELREKKEAKVLLEQAVTCCDAALTIYNETYMRPQYAAVLNNKANALLELAKLSRGEETIRLSELAIDTYNQVLAISDRTTSTSQYATAQQNKGNALVWLSKHHPSTEQRKRLLEQAIVCYSETFEIYPPLLTPLKHRTVALWLAQAHLALSRLVAEAAEANVQLDQAWTVASSGMEAARILERLAPSLEFRQNEWIENAALYAAAASIRALQGNATEAVTLLEAGRARGLAEAQSRRHTDLSLLTPQEREEYNTLANTILDIETRSRQGGDYHASLALATEAATANSALTRLVEQLRQTHPTFLPESRIAAEQLAQVLRSDELFIYLVPQPPGTLMLSIPPTGTPQVCWLPLTDDDAFALAVQPDEQGYNRRGYLAAVVDLQPGSLEKTLDELLPRLGEHLMRPVVQEACRLGARRAVLVPGGLLAALPLHAAAYAPLSPQDIPTASNGLRYACDDLLITYVPSGAAYLDAYRRSLSTSALKSGFVVSNPTLVQAGQPWDSRVRDFLPHAEREAATVASLMRGAGLEVIHLSRDDATRQAVLDGLHSADIIHLAMHAIFDPTDPLSSALLVALREKICVRDLLDARSLSLAQTRLAVLSACQSALGDFERQKEEALGVFGAFLAAGAVAVTGSLWPVYDLSTSLLMEAFTRRYLQQQQKPAIALHNAIRWMRGLPDEGPFAGQEVIGQSQTASSMTQQQWEELHKHEPATVRHLSVSQDDEDSLLELESFSAPLKHPIYWAAFVYYGV